MVTPHRRYDWSAWPTEAAEARALQHSLAGGVVEAPLRGPIDTVAGVDVHYDAARGLAFAAVCLLSVPDFALIESAMAVLPIGFPYVTGLLSFRETPPACEALAMLKAEPDLVIVDGQGRAHPRRLGLACHIGILTGLPTIGCAKSRLTGRYEMPGPERGAWMPLGHKGETIGAVVRSKTDVNPLFVSVGHRVTLADAIHWVLATDTGRRLPEPTRVADLLSRAHPSSPSSRVARRDSDMRASSLRP